MGRMLEVMKRLARPGSPEETPPAEAASPAPVDPEAAPLPEDAIEVPFIEVGGRGKAVDASPSVLVAPPPAARVLAQAEHERRLDVPSPRTPLLADAGPRGFVFQPAARTNAPRIASEIVAFHDEKHPVSEQYRALLARVQETSGTGEPAVLLFTALAPGAGTTTTVLNLAVTCCRHGRQRVVVVDANLARPAVARRLGIVQAPGLAEVLKGTAALEQALMVGPLPSLHALAATASVQEARLLGEENLRWLAARLRERFDIVLLDGPPWESNPEALALAAVADAVYLVLDAADAEAPPVRKFTRTLAQRGLRLGGLILEAV